MDYFIIFMFGWDESIGENIIDNSVLFYLTREKIEKKNMKRKR